MNLTLLSPGPNPPKVVYAVVEISKGGRNKYEYDPELGFFRFDRVLYSAVHYPACYGFIPGTRGEEGDPTGILVMTTEAAFAGCLIEVRPVGLFRMQDEEGKDEKVLAVPIIDPHFAEIPKLAH
jgi:inorganic pyrophosphatase